MKRPARAWIGLGGNRKDSASLLEAALARLAAAPRLTLLRHSRLYRSPPWGYLDQPDFVNSVAEFETELSPLELLTELQAAEGHLGREPKIRRWGPRSIDLDLLTYEDLLMRSDELELPHPRMYLRAFVLVPLLGIGLGRRSTAGNWTGAVLAVAGLYLLTVRGDISARPRFPGCRRPPAVRTGGEAAGRPPGCRAPRRSRR